MAATDPWNSTSWQKKIIIWLMLLLAAYDAYKGVTGACPINWLQNGHFCYLLTEGETRNWSNASGYCWKMSAHLASIHNESENMFIGESIRISGAKFKEFWIGLNDKAKENTFVWSDDTDVDFTNWHYGEPNGNTKENCGQVYYHKGTRTAVWNDLSCDREQNVICQISIPSKLITAKPTTTKPVSVDGEKNSTLVIIIIVVILVIFLCIAVAITAVCLRRDKLFKSSKQNYPKNCIAPYEDKSSSVGYTPTDNLSQSNSESINRLSITTDLVTKTTFSNTTKSSHVDIIPTAGRYRNAQAENTKMTCHIEPKLNPVDGGGIGKATNPRPLYPLERFRKFGACMGKSVEPVYFKPISAEDKSRQIQVENTQMPCYIEPNPPTDSACIGKTTNRRPLYHLECVCENDTCKRKSSQPKHFKPISVESPKVQTDNTQMPCCLESNPPTDSACIGTTTNTRPLYHSECVLDNDTCKGKSSEPIYSEANSVTDNCSMKDPREPYYLEILPDESGCKASIWTSYISGTTCNLFKQHGSNVHSACFNHFARYMSFHPNGAMYKVPSGVPKHEPPHASPPNPSLDKRNSYVCVRTNLHEYASAITNKI